MKSKQFAPQSGNAWVKKRYDIQGDWSITEENGEHFFTLEDNFYTSSGPDLKLYLTTEMMEDIGNSDSVDLKGEYIAELASNTGAHRYVLPKDLEYSSFNCIMIHCRKYSAVWGGIDLNA